MAHLRGAGLNPVVLPDALAAIDQPSADAAEIRAFLLSHPATAERLQAIRQGASGSATAEPVLTVD